MNNLRKLLVKKNIDAYVVPKNNEFFNEYLSAGEDRLSFLTKFDGSAGFAFITKNLNYLFVDGRYSIQAEKQSGKKFKIITIPKKFPKDVIKLGKITRVGFDPKLHTFSSLKFLFNHKNFKLIPIKVNLIDKIWRNKKKNKITPFFILKENITGESRKLKINKVKKFLIKKKLNLLFITSPENIAWLLNLRGKDCKYSPIPNCRVLLDTQGRIILFTKDKKVKKIRKYLKDINIIDENQMDGFLSNIKNKKIFVDVNTCSIHFKSIMGKNKIVEGLDPIYFYKSIKNKKEIGSMKKCHIQDGVALTKFLIWLKSNYKNSKITELSASKRLEKFRKENKNYLYPSFNTISGTGSNGAIIHYKPTRSSNKKLSSGDIYLVDSGGQYNFGTTDVTRTISLGNKSLKIKNIYTRVLKGHISVSKTIINKKINGSIIDSKARKFLREIGLDYPHGTGHGVGCFLNVHEGPQAFSKNNKFELKNGMIISNEPGYYRKGDFGIRIENLIFVNKKRFYELTLAPLDKDLIVKDILTLKELNWINKYHKTVQKKLLPYFRNNETTALKNMCSPI